MNARRVELEEQISKLRSELADIRTEEIRQKQAHLVGKCFRYRNSYSFPSSESDYWWMYLRFFKDSEGDLHSFAFQKDAHGEIRVEPDKLGSWALIDTAEEISPEEYASAWSIMLSELSDLYSQKCGR